MNKKLFQNSCEIHERIDPRLDLNVMKLSRLAHIKRYKKVCEYLRGTEIVLDAGCGFGYGTYMLSKFAAQTIGVDISPETIEIARQRYPEAKYISGDIETFNFNHLHLFDIITGFEIIEHLRSPILALQNFRKLIKNEGRIFISSPNKRNSSKKNKHHLCDYDEKDLERILEESGFKIEQTFCQYPLLGGIADFFRQITGYSSNTDKDSSIVPRIVDSVPLLPELFSNVYKNILPGSRGIYLIAKPV